MVNFFQKYKIVLIVVSCGLSLLGLASLNPGGIAVLTIPGVMLGVGTYLVNSKNKNSSKSSGDADELIKWNQLRVSGAISDEEFEKRKNEILG